MADIIHGYRVQSTFGVKEGRAKIISCQKPPHQKYGNFTGNAKLWNSAGVTVPLHKMFKTN
jgi:hypothetical protein